MLLMSNFAITVLTGIIIAVVSAWVTVQLALRRFRAEKWWEKRVEAYERVIEALHHSKAFTSVHLDAAYAGKDVPEERDKELRAKSKEALREIEKATDIGGFLLGEEALERLRRYQKEAKEASNTTSWHKYLEDDWAATNSCLENIIQIAKQDLQL